LDGVSRPYSALARANEHRGASTSTIGNNQAYLQISIFWRPNLQINQFKSPCINWPTNQAYKLDLI
jgi:hypothetical protein